MWQNIRLAFRMLRRVPSLSVPAILVMALGTGTAIALYTVVYAMWLRPLPYPGANRLVSVTTYFARHKVDALVSPDYAAWQQTHTLGALGAYSSGTATFSGTDDTFEVERANVSGNLLDVLRVHAALGRDIGPADDSPQAPKVAMLSDGLWRERFGADPHAVGRVVQIDGVPYTIAGVLPRGFRMPNLRQAGVVTPLALGEIWLQHSGGGMKILSGVARLQNGATLDQARAELSTWLAASRALAPQIYGDDVALRVIPLHAYAVRDVRTTAVVLSGAVASILLIATANVASLLVARAAGRTHRDFTRAALGASRIQIAGHLAAEGMAIGVVGVTSGFAVAQALIALAPRFAPAALLRDVAINGEVAAAALVAGVTCALAFSLMPVFPMPRVRLRRALVAGELALSLVLLVAAALLMESLAKLRATAPGFRTERLVTTSVSLKGTRFAERGTEFRSELRERLQTMPGVVSVAFADALPPSGSGRITPFSRADRPLPTLSRGTDDVIVRLVDGPFFETMGIPLLRGRLFTEHDEAVAVVNRTLAERFFAGENPIGKQVDGNGVPWKTVVGIAGDTRNDGIRNPARPEIYLPFTALNAKGGGITHGGGPNVVIRTAGDPSVVASALGGHLRAMDRSLLARVRMMDEEWTGLQAVPRFHATIFGGFAALALLMACAGVYGVLSHVVVLRRKEIGIRMALGARPVDVVTLIVREAMLLAGAGVLVGLACAAAGSRVLAALLDGVNARDPLTLAAAAALLVLLAITASIVPARRAAQEDPAGTLRAE